MPDEKNWLIFSHKWSGHDGYASWYADDSRGYKMSSLAAGRYTEAEAIAAQMGGIAEAVEIGSQKFRALLAKWAPWEQATWDELDALRAENKRLVQALTGIASWHGLRAATADALSGAAKAALEV